MGQCNGHVGHFHDEEDRVAGHTAVNVGDEQVVVAGVGYLEIGKHKRGVGGARNRRAGLLPTIGEGVDTGDGSGEGNAAAPIVSLA